MRTCKTGLADPWVRRGVVVVGLSVLVSLACDDPRPKTPVKTAPAKLISQGIITASATRYLELGTSNPYERFRVTAMFPRYTERNEDLLDTFLESRTPQPDLAMDSCSLPSPVLKARPRHRQSDETAVQLMDVGDMTIEYGGLPVPMPTRTFPDLMKVVDGVIYSADESRGVVFNPGATYTIHGTGTDQVSSFDVVLDAPNDLGEVTLDGINPIEQDPIIRRGANAILTWEGEGYGDEVIAQVDWTSMGLEWSITCRMKDDGRFVIPAEVTAGMRDAMDESEHEMSMTRVRQVAFRTSGLSSAEFRFVASTNFLLRFGP